MNKHWLYVRCISPWARKTKNRKPNRKNQEPEPNRTKTENFGSTVRFRFLSRLTEEPNFSPLTKFAGPRPKQALLSVQLRARSASPHPPQPANPRPLSALRTVAAARSPPAALPQHPALLLAARPSLAPPAPECRCVHSTHAPASPPRPALGLRTVAAAAQSFAGGVRCRCPGRRPPPPWSTADPSPRIRAAAPPARATAHSPSARRSSGARRLLDPPAGRPARLPHGQRLRLRPATPPASACAV